MTASYRAVNYVLRPSKCVERKMLGEALRRLSSFCSLEKYWYIGFGSTYFSDFYLFHKMLNITKMDSIEKDTGNKKRFEFNRPYRCIKLHFGDSNSVLPALDWNSSRAIVWLDYDGGLTEEVLVDIKTVFSSAISGSAIMISVNADPSEPPSERRNTLVNKLGRSRVSETISKSHFAKWGTAKIYRNIIQNEIQETLSDRSGGCSEEEELTYQQIFNFRYEDRAKMLTVGGILYKKSEEESFKGCNFEQLEFIKKSTESYLIRVPNLTYRELRHLDRYFPITGISSTTLPGVPQKDIEDYSKIYRYFPMFAETEL